MYRNLNNYPKAGEYFESARDLAIEELGKSHHDYATLTNNLANLLQLSGDYERALELYTESSNIYRMNYGEFNVNYATALNNIASLYRQMKEFDKAKELYLKVIQIDRQVLGESHPDYATVVNNLGILYSSMGQPKNAEPLYLKALELREEYLGINHPSYANSLENMGLYYFSHQLYPKSEEFFRRALNIRISQIESVFPTLTESERIQFYNASREDVERFYTIALKLHEEGSLLASYLYDVQLATKAIIYYASDKMRNAIFNSGDQELIREYSKWRVLNNQLARFYELGKMLPQK
jgi:tetratricopeptide (TPR) repeat protein